jgi:hypothetical protein
MAKFNLGNGKFGLEYRDLVCSPISILLFFFQLCGSAQVAIMHDLI